MKSQLKEKAAAFEPGEKLEHELNTCRARLAEVDELVASYKKAEALLQAEQRLTEKFARGDPIDDSAAPIRQTGGPLFGVVLVFRDFTERKHAEEALREAQRRLSLHATELEATVADRTAKLKEII